MSSTRVVPCFVAKPNAASDAARTVGVDRCVPVISSARQSAMNASSMRAASTAMSAQFSRTNSRGKVSRSFSPNSTRPVSRCASTCTCDVSQPSRCKVSTRKRPICSSPTRDTIAARRPSLAAPKAMLAELPPRYFAKLDTSSSRAPTCCAYKSTARRPRQAMSKRRPLGKRRGMPRLWSRRQPVQHGQEWIPPQRPRRSPEGRRQRLGKARSAAAAWNN